MTKPCFPECICHPNCSNDSSLCDCNIANGMCPCVEGWSGIYCDKEVDECGFAKSPCEETEVCENTRGSYKCSCKNDYIRVSDKCYGLYLL